MSGFEEIPVQEDRIHNWVVIYVVVATIVAIGGCVFVVRLMLHEHISGGGRSDIVELATVPPATTFDSATPLELERRARAVELERWQWADRAHRSVLVPIDVAIDRYVEAHR